MSIFNTILSTVSEHADVGNLAAKIGISPELAEQAIAALGASHQEPGDTVAGAAEKTGIDPSILSQVVSHIGGEGSLGEFARMLSENPQAKSILSGFDSNGDGSIVDELGGIAKGLFGKS